MPSKRIKQLKFISSIFNLSLKEMKETLGFETLTMIFRRVGEGIAESIVDRLKGKYDSVEEFCDLLVNTVINPVIDDKGSFTVDGNKVTLKLGACPYKKAAGFPVKDMSWFCDYTEGLIDTSFKLAFPGKNWLVDTKETIAKNPGCAECVFVAEF
ncbi:MAG: hypothetical protein ACTSU5_10150 [Promethearchaeota archaeon]